MKIILSLFLFVFGTAQAETKCSSEAHSSDAGSVSWDISSGSASYTDYEGRLHKGRVTHKASHNGGQKINLFIRYETPYYGSDASEFVVFPIDKKFRIIGANYIIRNNVQYLNTIDSGYIVVCRDL